MRPFTSSTIPVHVPEETGLVIQTVSVQVDVTSGNGMGAWITYRAGGEPTNLFLPLTLAYTVTATGYDVYHAAQQVTLYADAGTDVGLEVYSPDGQTGTSFLTVSGSLTNL